MRSPLILVIGNKSRVKTKEVIFSILKNCFKIRELKNTKIKFWQSIILSLKHFKLPQVLIKDVIPQRPGDFREQTRFIKPSIVVVTDIPESPEEPFRKTEGVVREYQSLLSTLDRLGFAILNADEHSVMELKDKTEARIITYGTREDADVRAVEIKKVDEGQEEGGINFKLIYQGSATPIFLKSAKSETEVSSYLAAITCGLALGLNPVELSEAISKN